MRTADLVLCERSLLEALHLLPEYGEAAAALGQLYRRLQRSADAAQALLVAFSTPPSARRCASAVVTRYDSNAYGPCKA